MPRTGHPISVEERVRRLNEARVRADAKYVLYWMRRNRRAHWNHALSYAVQWANELGLPVLCREELNCGPSANDRMLTFALEGVPENARRLAALGCGYQFHLREKHSEPDRLRMALASAAVLVTDDDAEPFALEFDVPIAAVAVESSCIVPVSRFEKREYAAYSLRPKITRMLPQYLAPMQPVRVKHRYPERARVAFSPVNIQRMVAACDIDHSVKPSLSIRGGVLEAERRLNHFIRHNIARYAAQRNEPSKHVTSCLSPYLRFGHVSSHEVGIATRSEPAFQEELAVRRELAHNFARFSENPRSLKSLPDWAQATLLKHAADKRPHVYDRDQFARAETHDELWNACQREMLLEGVIHGYYRMYWGKTQTSCGVLGCTTVPGRSVRYLG
ncbi:MAG: hypothetical protein EXQ52_09505 [Bryobacterales bacterium]|nr:hypothetical protein [Bryobacterales bacterium]